MSSGGGGGSGGKKDGGTPAVDYFLSIQAGIAHGPVDTIFRIMAKEKEAWVGIQNGEGAIFVNNPNLFGGNKKEGGVRGVAYFMPGTSEQVLPEGLAARLGLTSNNAPAGRGKASLWFVGGVANTASYGKYKGYGAGQSLLFGGSGGPESTGGPGGFLWGSNNPYMPSWEITAYRRPKGLSFATSAIENQVLIPAVPPKGDPKDKDNYDPGEPAKLYFWPDANGAHIIYECMTNKTWGMGASSTQFEVSTFEAAATTLFNEKFGLSLQWTEQARIEDFVTEILDHIQATLYVNPRTGLFELKLIRFDYDPDTLAEFGPEHANATNVQRKALEETINEIVVSWTNPITEQTETVTQQDIANISTQGQIISDSRNYYGIRRGDLAQEVAVRDLRSASYPLLSADIEVDRTAWAIKPGECIKFSWPDDGIDQVIMRVGKVDYGKPGGSTVKVSILEDIFSLSLAGYYSPPSTSWLDPDRPPQPLVYVEVMTVPYAIMTRSGFPVVMADYPAVAAMVLGSSPAPGVQSFELSGPVPLPSGGTAWDALGSITTTAHGFLVSALPWEAESIVTAFPGLVGSGEGPVVDGFVLIGTGEDEEQEIALITAYADGVGFSLRRGLLDTVPRPWPARTPVWFVNDNSRVVDGTQRAPGPFEYKMQTRTTSGLLKFEDAPLVTSVLTDRPYLPNRPANVKVNNVAFASVFYETQPTSIPVSWSTRNRLLEDTVFPTWTAASNAPEEEQKTKIVIIDRDSGEVVHEIDDLPGTSYDVPWSAFQGIGGTTVRVVAVRDDLESLQGHEIDVDVAGIPGYGNSYGDMYGDGT